MKTKYGLWPYVRVKEILEQKNLTQKEFAEKIGETPQQVNKWIMGVEPCLSSIGRIAITLGVQICDLVWYAGDDAGFNVDSCVYVRGVVGGSNSTVQILQTLRDHYRWTAEELAGVKIVTYNAEKNEVTLGCVGADASDAFITWAKRHREDMYRL